MHFVFIHGIRLDTQSSTAPPLPPTLDFNRDGEFENLRLGRSGGGIWGVEEGGALKNLRLGLN